ncbi:MAG: hypothetical protein WCQ70_09520 [Lentimicrobiaceae bacterium]
MKKCIYILFIISIISCTQHENKKQLGKKDKDELIMDSKILNSFQDSLNATGNIEYYTKYMLKIDEMIKKYPDPYRKNYLKVRKSMKEIYGDSQSSSKTEK